MCKLHSATCDTPSSFICSWYGLPFGGEHSFDKDGNGILGRDELMRVLSLLQREAAVAPHHRLLFLSFVDVDDSNTVSFAEFALALKRAQDDFVLKEVCVWTSATTWLHGAPALALFCSSAADICVGWLSVLMWTPGAGFG